MTDSPEPAMPESPRHWPAALWRVKKRKQEEEQEEENKTQVPSDLTSPTSPADRPATVAAKSPKSPLPTLDEAEAADGKENKKVPGEEERVSEEDLLSDSEIQKNLLLLQKKKEEDSPNMKYMCFNSIYVFLSRT